MKRLLILIALMLIVGNAQAIDFYTFGGTKVENGDFKIAYAGASQIKPSFYVIAWSNGEGDNLDANIDGAYITNIFWRVQGGVLAGPGIDQTPENYYTFGYGLILGVCITEKLSLWGVVKRNGDWNESNDYLDNNTFFFGLSTKL